jgi:hypothetical protein
VRIRTLLEKKKGKNRKKKKAKQKEHFYPVDGNIN